MRKTNMRRALVLSGVATTALLIAACGSDDDNKGNSADGGADSNNAIDLVDFDPDAGTLPNCATASRQAEKLPLDMAIGLDTSFSMDFYGKWTQVQSALRAFIKNPAYSDLGISLQFFPNRKTCSVEEYKIPVVPMTLLPSAAGPMEAALAAQQMSGGTPMVPLLQGLGAYLKEVSLTRPNRKPVLVLATDGFPDETCTGGSTGTPNTLDNAVKISADAHNGKPAIDTFVIGVGSELKALDAIAAAGGTNSALIVDTSQNVEQAFLIALDSIRKQSIPCDYDIPTTAGAVDPKKVNVTFTNADGTSELFLYTGSDAGCVSAPTSGWYFDNEAAPTKVIFCGQSCDRVKSDDKGRVDVVFGCDRAEAPVIR